MPSPFRREEYDVGIGADVTKAKWCSVSSSCAEAAEYFNCGQEIEATEPKYSTPNQ